MSRRMANLLASTVVAAIVSVSVHAYLSGQGAMGGAPAPDTEEPPTVRLAFSGIAPRVPLRLDVEAGHVELVTLRVWQRVTGQGGVHPGARLQDASDAMVAAEGGDVDASALAGTIGPANGEREAVFTARLRVREVDGAAITIAWDMRAAGVVPHGEAPEWERAVKRARRLRGTTTIATTGAPLSATIDGLSAEDRVARDLETMLRRWMAEPAPVFPEEPVGHGAIWDVERDLTEGGVHLTQTQRLELRALRAGKLELVERASGALRGSAIDLGPALQALDPEVSGFSFRGDGAWEHGAGTLAAVGDAGGDGTIGVSVTLGLGGMEMVSHMETETHVTRAAR